MKHLLSSTLALAALVMLGACSSDDDIATATGGVTNNNENVPVAFQNYVGRDITTRGTIETIGTIGTKGFGVYAYDFDGYYGSTTARAADTDTKNQALTTNSENFSDNFMSNQQVTASSSVAANSTAWTYSPLKYWPQASTERISFLAYAPYTASAPSDGKGGVDPALVAKDGTSTDRTYIKYTVDTDPANHVDLMWNTTNALNQYLYLKADGSDYEKSANFNSALEGGTGNPSGTKALRQNMKFSHATARVALVVTSGVLNSKLNFNAGVEENTDVTLTGYTKDGDATTTTSESDAQLTVNKVILMGAPTGSQGNGTQLTGASGDEAAGAFYKEGYLNLNNNNPTASLTGSTGTKIYTPDWKGQSTDKVAFTFDSFVSGSLGSFAKDDATNTVGSVKAWNPTETAAKVIKSSATTTTTKYKKDDSDPVEYLTVTKVTVGDNQKANYIGTSANNYMFVIPEDFTTDILYAYMEYDLVYTDYKNDPQGWILTHTKADGTSQYTLAEVAAFTEAPSDAKEAPKHYYSYGKISKNLKGGHSYVIVANIGGQDGTTTPDADPKKPTSFSPIQFTVEEVVGWGDEEDPDASL